MRKHLLICLLFFCIPGFSSNDLEFERLNSNNGLSSEEIRNIFQDKDGYMWFLTRNGLNCYDGYDIEVYKSGYNDLDFKSNAFECMCQDDDGLLWLGSIEKGIMIFDRKNKHLTSFEEYTNGLTLNDNHIRTLNVDRKENIWVGTEYGLYKYEKEANKLSYFNLGGLDEGEPRWCIIESFLEDSYGNLWIGTWNNGLFIIDNASEDLTNHLIFNKSQATVNDNRIKSIFEDASNNIWIGTWEDGLYQVSYHSGNLEIDTLYLYNASDENTIAGDIIYAINQDNNNKLWVGTPYGITIIDDLYSQQPVFSKISFEWQLFGGQLLPFTFVYGGQDNWSGEESVPEDCNFGTPSAPERHYTAPFENESPQTIPFGECVGNNGLVSVTYRVDMNAVTMDEGDIVWAHVNPNDLWPEMSDEDNDGVYTVTLNHYPDIEVDYYFAYGTNEEYDEETVPAECSNDQGWREYTVTGEDHILPAFKYGSCDFTGLNNVSSITNYSIYPNPAINDITIDINQAYRYAEISLLDIHGRLISKWQIEQQEQFSVPLDQYSNGLYFIKMDIDNVIKTQKLIIGK